MRESPSCVYPKVQKLATGEYNGWIDASSLKSELRVAVVREIYGRKFIYNFS